MSSSWGSDQWLRRGPAECISFPGELLMASDGKSDGKSRSGPPAETGRSRGKTPAERPFDIWLQKQLHAMYDEIASEPLPDDLLGLIERDAAKSKKGEPAKNPTSSRKK